MADFSERLREAQAAQADAARRAERNAAQAARDAEAAERMRRTEGIRRAQIAQKLAGALIELRAPFDRTISQITKRQVTDYSLFGRPKGSHTEQVPSGRFGVWELSSSAERPKLTDEHGWIAEYGQDYRLTALTTGGVVCRATVQIPRQNDTEKYPAIPRDLTVGVRSIDSFQVYEPEQFDEGLEDALLGLAARHPVDPAIFK